MLTKRPKDRRAQIALVAAELFCARGYHVVGIDEIAAAVGISGPAVYRHFPNKYALLVEASRDQVGAMLAATAGCADLDDLVAALARTSVDRRRVGGLYQWEGRYLTPEHRAEFRAELDLLVARLSTPLRALRPELTAGGADALAQAAHSALASLSTHRAVIARPRAVAVLHRLGWAMLRAEPVSLDRPAAVVGPVPLRPASRRELLLTEAIALFRKQGYHAVGMEEIGRAAGINASSVYRYFPSKADLLAAAYHRASERLAGMTSAVLASCGDPGDALRRLTAAYVSFAFSESDLVSVYLMENRTLPERDRHELRKTQRLHVEEWVGLLTAARPGLPAAEARVLVHAALNVITDLGRVARFAPGADLERGLEDLAIRALFC